MRCESLDVNAARSPLLNGRFEQVCSQRSKSPQLTCLARLTFTLDRSSAIPQEKSTPARRPINWARCINVTFFICSLRLTDQVSKFKIQIFILPSERHRLASPMNSCHSQSRLNLLASRLAQQ